MKNKLKIFIIALFALILISIFYRWFFQSEIIGGDWPYLFKESLQNYYFFVPSWNTWQGNGLGGTNPIYFLQTFEYLTVFVSTLLHIPWPIIYKIFWFGFFLLLSISSSFYLVNIILKKCAFWQKCISSIIFTTNTYVLMLVDGGQMGVALSYALTPFVIVRFIKLIDEVGISDEIFTVSKLRLGLLAGLLLAFQVVLDPRLAYISMIAVGIYILFKLKGSIQNILSLLSYAFIIPGLVTLLINIFWILPLFIFSQNTCERFCEAYSGVGIVKFLSFSSFSESLSLLHPNWPENIFGKVGFMKPEFLAIPLIGYLSLVFVGRNRLSVKILFFALLGILGALLVKGTNPPFGQIYLWLYEKIPGFVLFRDPTKFYLFTALSYSILIPFVISEFQNKFSKLSKVVFVSPIIFLVFWATLIWPAITGQLKGTFKSHEVSKEYIELKDFLYKQPDFFRTLWVPRQQRFAFYSKIHLPVEAGALFDATSSAQIIEDIRGKGPQYLSELSVKYIIVPYDNLGEIFQKDRKYDKKEYENVINKLNGIAWIKKIDGFGKIAVFQTSYHKDHISLSGNGKITSRMIAPYRYAVTVSINKPQKLIFSEKHNRDWIMKDGKNIIYSEKTPFGLNSFDLKKTGVYSFEIYFLQEDYYFYGRIISMATILITALILVLPRNFSLRN